MALTPQIPATKEDKLAKRRAAEEDVLLREVDEAVRQGDMEAFTQKWGKPLLAGVVLLILAFGGYLYWQSRQEAAMERNSEQLVSALDQLEAGNFKTAYDQLDALAANGESAAGANARLMRAGIAAQQGRTDEAAQLFAQVAGDEGTPQAIRDLARVREIATRYDSMKPADVVAALKPLAVPGKPFFGSAGELVANAYLDMGNRAEAGALFAQIANEEDVPDGLQSRARQMAGLLGVDAIEDVDALLEQQGVDREAANGETAAAPTQ